jgi:hypothetical protein
MECTRCKQELDEASELTNEQINKYAETPIEPVCNTCLQDAINQQETIQ